MNYLKRSSKRHAAKYIRHDRIILRLSFETNLRKIKKKMYVLRRKRVINRRRLRNRCFYYLELLKGCVLEIILDMLALVQ